MPDGNIPEADRHIAQRRPRRQPARQLAHSTIQVGRATELDDRPAGGRRPAGRQQVRGSIEQQQVDPGAPVAHGPATGTEGRRRTAGTRRDRLPLLGGDRAPDSRDLRGERRRIRPELAPDERVHRSARAQPCISALGPGIVLGEVAQPHRNAGRIAKRAKDGAAVAGPAARRTADSAITSGWDLAAPGALEYRSMRRSVSSRDQSGFRPFWAGAALCVIHPPPGTEAQSGMPGRRSRPTMASAGPQGQ